MKVKVENSLGQIEASANLKVDRKREIPTFLTDMKDQQVTEGNNVRFSARISGNLKVFF